MKYKLVVFDLDGTILDTTEGILEAVEYTIAKFGLPQIPHETLLSFIGPPIQESFMRYYDIRGEILQQISDEFRKSYSSTHLLKAQPYCGIYQLFNSLTETGVKIAIATYKREDYALKLLHHYDFDKFTSIMHGGDNLNKLKKSDIITKCIQEAEISDAKDVVMIGDTIFDAEGAKTLGIDFIAVTYGFGFHPNAPENICSIGYAKTPLEILNILNNEN